MSIFWVLFLRSPLPFQGGKSRAPIPYQTCIPPATELPRPWGGRKLLSELPPRMPDVVLVQPCFLGKVLTTLCAGKGARKGVGLVCLAMPPQRSSLPEGLATVGTGEGGWCGDGCSRLGGPGHWTVAALVGDQGLGGGEGSGAGEADEEDPLQLLGHEVRWVLPLHVALLELGIGEGDEAAGALQGPQVAEVTSRTSGTSLLGRILLLHGLLGVPVLHGDWDPSGQERSMHGRIVNQVKSLIYSQI